MQDENSSESKVQDEFDDRQVGVRLGVQRKEPCRVCGLPVFLAEKLVIARSLYHRTCFRCARCNNQLTLGNYYETEEGQYCCETCPDEEIAPLAPVMHQDYNQTALQFGGREEASELTPSTAPTATYKRALSDEEKSRSSKFSHSEEAKTRRNFMTSHLLSSGDNDGCDYNHGRLTAAKNAEISHPDDDKEDRTLDESDETSAQTRLSSVESLALDDMEEVESESKLDEEETRFDTESVNNKEIEISLGGSDSINNQQLTATAMIHDIDSKTLLKPNEDTKETVADGEIERDKARTDHSGERLSLVKQRLKIFENSIAGGESSKIKGTDPTVNIVAEYDAKIEAKGEGKTVKKSTEESKEPSPTSDSIQNRENSSGNIEVQFEATQPLDLPEEKAVTAAVILQKMMESREPRRDTDSVDTTLSNVSGVDLSGDTNYPEDLNPFQSDEEDEMLLSPVKHKSEKTASTNPFGSSDEEEPEEPPPSRPPRPAARKNNSIGNKTKENPGDQTTARRRLQAPQISLNPFWSDDEEHASEDDNGGDNETKNTPVPKPRTIKLTPEPSPVPRKTSLDRGGLYASNTSIASEGSLITPGGTYRKKKPAPPPPPAEEIFCPTSTFDTLNLKSIDDSQSAKVVSSPRTPRIRKMKPAPPPPMSTSTPQSLTDSFTAEAKEREDDEDGHSAIWDDQKNSKDETNRNRQSLGTANDELSQHYPVPFVDKSSQGKWKRKKGPAPPRPIPHKRKIKVMSVKDVKMELDEIELQQQGLEKQGVRLEQLIRDKSETGQENEEFTSLRVDVEELVLELFALVNEKNELFRRQAELMLLRRQQRLEEEHADVEYQIRCLMSQPEATKTDSDKQREEVLIQRLVEIVERRNEIVECLEMDRRREVEEDRSINEQMGIFAAKNKGSDVIVGSDNVHGSSVQKKENEKSKDKVKEKKVKKSHKKDADKDVDETEMKLKRHKKKWF